MLAALSAVFTIVNVELWPNTRSANGLLPISGGRLCGNEIKSSSSPGRGARAEVSMRAATRLVALIAIILLLPGMLTARAVEEVDLLLVLSSDVSRSIDTPKFKLQRDVPNESVLFIFPPQPLPLLGGPRVLSHASELIANSGFGAEVERCG
jgi:hypothetical protein